MAGKKNASGRICILKSNPKKVEAFKNQLRKMLPIELCAYSSGISPRTIHYWLAQGKLDYAEDKETIYSVFLQDIKEIESKIIDDLMSEIKSGQKNWQAIAWILERRWNKYFSANVAVRELNELLDDLVNSGKLDKSNANNLKEEFKNATR